MYLTIGAKVRTRRSRSATFPVSLYCRQSFKEASAEIRPSRVLTLTGILAPCSRGKQPRLVSATLPPQSKRERWRWYIRPVPVQGGVHRATDRLRRRGLQRGSRADV